MNSIKQVFGIILLGLSSGVWASGLIISLSQPSPVVAYKQSDDLLVKFSLTNTSNQDIRVLKRQTPLEGNIYANIFNVSYNNQVIAYSGILVKRKPPQDSDYILISPNETVSDIVNIGKSYAIKAIGQYQISFKNERLRYQLVNNKQDIHTQKIINIEQTPDLVIDLAEKRTGFVKKNIVTPAFIDTSVSFVRGKQPPAFNGCSAPQQSILNSTLDESERISLIAKNDLNGVPINQRSNAIRYTTWFGNYNISRYNTVRTHFNNIYSTLVNQTIGLDCTCDEDYFAHVSPNDPYTIYLCNAFWNAPLNGVDSKAGVIVHELSHFAIVAGTEDHVYGTSGAQSLAQSNPANAIDNADNYEYFSENTPSLPMPTRTAIPISDAVDNTNLSFTNSGNANWFGQTSIAYSGGDAAQSGYISDSQQSCIQTTVAGSGNLSFYWRVSSESSYDFLRFDINDSEQSDKISGSTNWAQKSYALSNGDQILKWCYIKDSDMSRDSDTGWVDKIVYTTTSNSPPSSDDIYLTNARLNLTSVVAGAQVRADVNQCYSGSITNQFLDNPDVGYWLSSDTSWDSNSDIDFGDDSSSIGSDDRCDDENKTFTIPANTVAGNWYVLFVADENNEVNETNENNNIKYVALTVNGPAPITPPTPPAPSARIQSSTQIDLSWTAVSNANYYRLFNGSTQIYAGSTRAYNNTGLTASTAYSYTLRACRNSDINTCSDASSATNITSGAIPNPNTPSAPTADVQSPTQINLSWTGVSGASHYRLFNGSDEIYTGSNLTYNNTGLTASTAYSYTLRACRNSDINTCSDASSATSITSGAIPNPDVDNIAPVLTGSAVTLNAEHRRTAFAITDFRISAIDAKDGTLTATVSSVNNGGIVRIFRNRVILNSGESELIWQASDAAGNRATLTQTVKVLPVANFAFGRKIGEGQTTFTVHLSGLAADYPVRIPFTVSGNVDSSDYMLTTNSFVISSGTLGTVTATIIDNADTTEERMILTMGTLTNAVKGRYNILTTTILPSTSSNISPRIRGFNVVQGGVSGRVVEDESGNVIISADVLDVNGDTLTYTWESSDLTLSSTDSSSVSFDPSGLSGSHIVALTLSDGTDSVERKITIRVVTEVALGNDDTNGDGITDTTEGRGDNDNNGIPDYRERPHESYELATGTDTYIVAPIGTRLVRGSMAEDSGKLTRARMQAYLTANGGDTLKVDSHRTTADIFDYKVAELLNIGGTATIVIQTSSMPRNASLRKYILATNEWTGFVTNNRNTYTSVSVEDGVSCPAAEDSTEWDSANGLTAGDNCLRIIIEDGGENDADGARNGSIDDPVAIAETLTSTPTPTPTPSTGGGGGSIYWLSALLLMMLVPFGLRKTGFDRRS